MSITAKLARTVMNYDSRQSLGSRFRAKRIALLLDMIAAVYHEKGCVNVIDVGGTQNYWNIVPREFLDRHRVSITLVNLPAAAAPKDHGPFRFVAGDGCNLLEFPDSSFDIAHSNSVVEHVGDWQQMVRFAREITRVSERIFVQSPNFWFPLEPHCATPFFHWLPKPARVWLVLHFQLGHWPRAASVDEAVRSVESARLLNKKMFAELFRDAEILTETVLLLPKSFIAVRK